MTLESFRGLLYEIRDLSRGGAMYAGNVSEDKVDGPFNMAMYNVIAEKADTPLGLFDILDFMPEQDAIEQKIVLQYGDAE